MTFPATVAPPPPVPSGSGNAADNKNQQMNVKRINWEKLDGQRVENTVWEQVTHYTFCTYCKTEIVTIQKFI